MVATYKALFNGQSKFGVRGQKQPIQVGAIILDDAHVAVSVVRDSFTLTIDTSEERTRYESLAELFRRAFRDMDRVGTFDDVVGGKENMTLEIPYWAWHEQIDAVREQLRAEAHSRAFVWPLLRDHLHLCHAIVGQTKFTITAILPLVNAFPTFSEAPRRIYMSATISDDTDIIRTFDADPKAIPKALKSRSLAGISERMILIPSLMPFRFDAREAVEKLAKWTATKRNAGAVILVPSDKSAAGSWGEVGTVAKGSSEVEQLVADLQTGTTFGPAVFSNRYDGIDLPGNSCRLSRLRNSWGLRLGAVLNSPGEHPFALDRRLDAGSGGPAARREVEVGLFRRVADRAQGHRWVTDAGRAPRGGAGGALVMSPGVRAGRR